MNRWTIFIFTILFCPPLSGCAQSKTLDIQEVCFTRVNEIGELSLRCYDRDGKEYDRNDVSGDKYTCFNTKEASKLSAFTDKCLKAGVKP
jgi:hypothetical protein